MSKFNFPLSFRNAFSLTLSLPDQFCRNLVLGRFSKQKGRRKRAEARFQAILHTCCQASMLRQQQQPCSLILLLISLVLKVLCYLFSWWWSSFFLGESLIWNVGENQPVEKNILSRGRSECVICILSLSHYYGRTWMLLG